ncbi:MAG: 2-C-methyl-D-erythritol 4-phosphate cytidylyltransferase [Burkholderiaceae bacterium]
MPTASSRCFALVPCAGVGVRAGGQGPKQYQRIAGRPVVAHTLAALTAVARIEATLVVLAPADDAFERHLPDFAGRRCWLARCGGATRAESVSSGLGTLVERGVHANDWVLVHDAARCLVRPEWVDALIDACLGDAVGGLLALPLADTLKTEQDGRVGATIDRHAKWLAQTPQMFRLGALRDALAQAGAAITDEAGAMELAGLAPKLVPGALENFKVTFAADFALAERLLKGR